MPDPSARFIYSDQQAWSAIVTGYWPHDIRRRHRMKIPAVDRNDADRKARAQFRSMHGGKDAPLGYNIRLRPLNVLYRERE